MPSEHDIAFPRLARAQIDALRRRGRVRPITPGDVLFQEGDRGFSCYVVLEGAVDTGRAIAGSDVLELTAAELRQAVDALPEPGEFVLKAFLTRHVVGSLPQKTNGLQASFRSHSVAEIPRGLEPIFHIVAVFPPVPRKARRRDERCPQVGFSAEFACHV